MNKALVFILIILAFVVLLAPPTKADKVTGDMHCISNPVEIGKPMICDINLKLLNPNDTVILKLKRVYLNNKEIWPLGPPPGTVTVPSPSLNLNPHNVKGSIIITLTFDNEMADHYFGKPVIGNYIDKFGGREYLITVEIDNVSRPISTQVAIKEDAWGPIRDTLLYLLFLAIYLGIVKISSKGDAIDGPLVLATFSGFVGVCIARIGSGLQWDLKYGYWPPDIPSLILLIPIAAIHVFAYKRDQKTWKPIFTALLWFLMITATKYGSNSDVVGVVLSLTLWVLMEAVSIISRGAEAGKKALIPLIIAPYIVPVSYYLLTRGSEVLFWVTSLLILALGKLLATNLYYSSREKEHLLVMYLAMIVLFTVSHSLYSLAYSVPLLGITILLWKVE
ncbi:hypothetical protein [Thermococcus sp.]|uniref:hypothetical protein n=1 Tax=Thermococcus sp. TaxID=35749 RepID=UPI0026363765|nr:hypothetical protein [Thermococcus sp.]